ncbi:MAG: site-2 protease family protein [Candidatus Hydrogenedentes bacterium]|nr:site-2 protease family protein [Candidatus Hydrogenedentota bacterium]
MPADPASTAIFLGILLFSLCVHEAAHAAMAYYCGDDTARLQGRLTLNPLAHIDPLGTVILPLLLVILKAPFVFGWAKPVPFNPSKLNNVRRDPVLIAMAGPASNLFLALFFAFTGRIYFLLAGGPASVPTLIFDFFFNMLLLNFILMLFNLIPIPPLDGHHVLNYFLPPRGQRAMQQIGPFGILIAIVLARPLFAIAWPPLRSFIFAALGA